MGYNYLIYSFLFFALIIFGMIAYQKMIVMPGTTYKGPWKALSEKEIIIQDQP